LSKASDRDQLKNIIEKYQEDLRTTTNVKNLKKFVEVFLKSVNCIRSVDVTNSPCTVAESVVNVCCTTGVNHCSNVVDVAV